MHTTPPQPRGSASPVSGTGEPLTLAYPGVAATDYLHIRDYLRILYRRRRMIVAIILIGLLGAVVLNWTTTTIYEAQATLQIDADPNVLALDHPVVEQRDWMREFLPTQLGILASRDLARMALDKLKSPDDGTSPPQPGEPQLPTVEEIVKGRSIEAIKDTRLVNIGFRSTDPVLSAKVANALALAYFQRTLEFKSRTTGEASDWLSQQVNEQRKVLEASEAALQAYREEHGADSLFTDRLGTEQQNIVVQKLGQLQAAVSKAREDTIEKEAQYNQLTAIEAAHEPLDSMPAIASNSFIQGLKGELNTLQRELAQASSELGERHPDMIKLRGAVQNAELKLQSETSNVADAIRNDYEAARARERALVAALARQRTEVQALNGKAVEYTALEREATSNRDALDKLLQRSRETRLARELQSTNVGIVDSAEVPLVPILPRKTRTLLLALVGSTGLAIGLVFLLEICNTRITSPEDVERHLRVNVLGVTPQVKGRKRGPASPLLSDGVPPQFAEMLHSVRTKLIVAPELATVRTLLVTSSEPAEGKTMAAANLAVSLARLNQRVLVIDADLRNPQLHKLFGEEHQPGLSDALTGPASTSQCRRTKVPRLWLMPAGRASRNPADLLGSERFRQLVDLLHQQFDWVVIDSPPVLAVTDPCLIARAVSGVLFVVASGQTSRDAATAAVARLDAAGANIVGAMLNRAVLDQPGMSYLPYYHRDYRPDYPQQESGDRPEFPAALPDRAPADAASSFMSQR